MRLLNRSAGRLSRHRRGPLAGLVVLLLGLVLSAVDLGYQVVVPRDAVAGVPNEIMGEGPIPATKLALKKGGLPHQKIVSSPLLADVIREMGFKKADDFYIALGGAKISAKIVVNKVMQRLKQGDVVLRARDLDGRGRGAAVHPGRPAPRRGATRAPTGRTATRRRAGRCRRWR